MPPKKKNKSVIAICIQEPFEDGSSMDFGAIKGDEIRFLHQAFITDTISSAFEVDDTDVRLYFIGSAGRKRLVKIVTEYLKKKATDKKADNLKNRFHEVEMKKNRWGIRIEEVFEDCFKNDYNHVLVIGSRTPTITPAMMKTALKMLSESQAVFGPTPDGRYYAIGMSNNYHIKLSDFDWKSPSIYSEVADAFSKKKLAWSELEIWYAVEASDDLEIMVRDINQFRFEGNETIALETEKVIERILTRLEP